MQNNIMCPSDDLNYCACLGDWSSIIVVIIVQQSVGKEQCEAGGDTWFNFRSGTTTTPGHYCGTTTALLWHFWHKQENATHSHLADKGTNWTTYIVSTKKMCYFLDVVEGRFRCWSRLAVRAESDRFSQSLTYERPGPWGNLFSKTTPSCQNFI